MEQGKQSGQESSRVLDCLRSVRECGPTMNPPHVVQSIHTGCPVPLQSPHAALPHGDATLSCMHAGIPGGIEGSAKRGLRDDAAPMTMPPPASFPTRPPRPPFPPAPPSPSFPPHPPPPPSPPPGAVEAHYAYWCAGVPSQLVNSEGFNIDSWMGRNGTVYPTTLQVWTLRV